MEIRSDSQAAIGCDKLTKIRRDLAVNGEQDDLKKIGLDIWQRRVHNSYSPEIQTHVALTLKSLLRYLEKRPGAKCN